MPSSGSCDAVRGEFGGQVREVSRGDESLKSAEILLASGMLADATSHAHYGAFHCARALLLMLGGAPLSHAGVEQLLHRDVVRAGLLDADIARQLGRLQKMQQDADYTSEVVFTLQGATEDISLARESIAAARGIIERGGWFTSET